MKHALLAILVIVLTAITVQGEEGATTASGQINVPAPQASDSMQFRIIPSKTTVYVGEPLPIELTWTCPLRLGSLRALQLNPAFFYDPRVEVLVPRPICPKEEQLGLPVGGRRIIASNPHTSKAADRSLGTVSFTLYLRMTEPGQLELPATRLQCTHLLDKGSRFTSYAAFFNNSLFESPDPKSNYELLYGTSDATTIEVLPLPAEGRSPSFSGLFAPLEIAASITPTATEVRDLMELRLRVHSATPSEFLALPPLTGHAQLRHQFWISSDTATLWHPDGREFITRFRPLTTALNAFPALTIQVFDPNLGRYQPLKTSAIPLTISPSNGQSHFEVRSIPGAASLIESSAAGIGNNVHPTAMSTAIDSLTRLLVDGFWFWIVLGPVVFFTCRPFVSEWRRRKTEPAYGRRARAYARFRKQASPAAFREFLATSLGRKADTLTGHEVRQALQQAGADDETTRTAAALYHQQESTIYNPQASTSPPPPDLRPAARRLHRRLNRLVLLASLGVLMPISEGHADTWTTPQASLERALVSANNSPDTATQQFGEAALGFEASAKDDEHSGLAWFNAGNAWFKAGELGRAIAAYRQAQSYRPFDSSLRANLAASRALCLDTTPPTTSPTWLQWPLRWQLALLAAAWISVWLTLLARQRFCSRALTSFAVGALAVCLLLTLSASWSFLTDRHDGVLIVDEIEARKGPAWSYDPAFLAPLHNGLEFSLTDQRHGWLELTLPDGRHAWIPDSSAVLIPK